MTNDLALGFHGQEESGMGYFAGFYFVVTFCFDTQKIFFFLIPVSSIHPPSPPRPGKTDTAHFADIWAFYWLVLQQTIENRSMSSTKNPQAFIGNNSSYHYPGLSKKKKKKLITKNSFYKPTWDCAMEGVKSGKKIFYGRTWDLEGLVEVSDIGDGILASKQAVVSRFPSALNYKWENRKNKNAHASYPFFIGFHSWPPCVLSPWLRRDHLFHPNALPLVVVTFQRWLESPNFNNFPQTCPSGYCQTFGETFFIFFTVHDC